MKLDSITYQRASLSVSSIHLFSLLPNLTQTWLEATDVISKIAYTVFSSTVPLSTLVKSKILPATTKDSF